MKAYVGITDGDWYELLRTLPRPDEVNFWKPGGKQRFRALSPGELFLFKLHSPRSYIVGGGFFVYSTILPVRLAWESFGVENGAPSFDEMCRRIEQYRRVTDPHRGDYDIGCVLLAKPFFLPESAWIAAPDDWGRGIQQGKGYDLSLGTGAALYRQLEPWLYPDAIGPGGALRSADSAVEVIGGRGTPVLMAPRLGQGAFRVLVTDAYQRRCAITGEKVLPVLQAAHIRPFAQQGPHRIQNGLLLRSDLHTLFDQGYVTVTPDLGIEVSHRLHEDFDNGKDYFALHGEKLRMPAVKDHRPSDEFLGWHNANVYLG